VKKNLRQAMRDLGYCLHEGIGVKKDYEAAARWYRKAAKAGDAKAQYTLGLCYLDGEGLRQSRRCAAYWFRKATHQGHKMAKKNLSAIAEI
jgi:hypothetical protein